MSGESQVLGKAIQKARQNAGLTQQELCQRANLSYSTLAKIERGAIKTPSVFTVQRVASVLGISMDSLLGAAVDGKNVVASPKKTSKSGIKFVYFDINGCLVHFFHAAFLKISQETGVPSDKVESAFWHYNDAASRGDMTIEEFNKAFAFHIGADSVDWIKEYVDAVEPVEEMHELLQWASQHYKVGLLTNITPGSLNRLLEYGKIPHVKFDAVVDSSVVGAIKPEDDIYKIAAAETGVNPEEILFVDDNRINLMSAERLGWRVMSFDDYHAEASAKRIKDALEF